MMVGGWAGVRYILNVTGFNAVASLVKMRQSRAHAHWIAAFDRARKPMIAAIHRYCLGGGLEIALACDY